MSNCLTPFNLMWKDVIVVIASMLHVAGNSTFNSMIYHASCPLSGQIFWIVLISWLFLSSTGEVSSTKAASKGGKSVGKESIGGKPKVDNQSREVVIETSSGVADDNVQGTSLLQVSTAKTVEFSDDRVVRVKQPSCFGQNF